MKVAGKYGGKKKTPNPNLATRVQESWSNLKNTAGGIMEFNTASKEKCKKNEMTNVISKFEG